MIRLHDTIGEPQFFDPSKIAQISVRKAGGAFLTCPGVADAIPVKESVRVVLGLLTLWKHRDTLRDQGLLSSEDPMMAAAFDEENGYHFIYAEWGTDA